jgi:hypothetical protein
MAQVKNLRGLLSILNIRGGCTRSSDEVAVMAMERRGAIGQHEISPTYGDEAYVSEQCLINTDQ